MVRVAVLALVVGVVAWADHNPVVIAVPGILAVAWLARAVARGPNRDLAPLAVLVVVALGFGVLALVEVPIKATDGLPLAVPLAIGALLLAFVFFASGVLGLRYLLQLRRSRASSELSSPRVE